MQTDSRNIYKKARMAAGITQERAAELLDISVRSLADYESGVRVPQCDVVDGMVTVYNSQLLAVQHVRMEGQAIRDILPEVRAMRLPEAVLTLVHGMYEFYGDHLDRELIDMARDGVISEDEEERFERIMQQIGVAYAAYLSLRCSHRDRRD
mgnify:CR=1 FL=1